MPKRLVHHQVWANLLSRLNDSCLLVCPQHHMPCRVLRTQYEDTYHSKNLPTGKQENYSFIREIHHIKILSKWSTPVRVRYLRQFTVTSNRCRLPANDVYSDIVKEKKCNVLIKNTLLQVTYTGYDHSPHLHKLPAFWRPAVQICNRGKRFLVRTSSIHGKVNQFLTNGALTGIHEMTITGIFHHASKQGWFSFFFVFQEKVTARSFKYPVDNETCNFLNGGKTKEKRNLEENNKLF